jgi:hypothetical protein
VTPAAGGTGGSGGAGGQGGLKIAGGPGGFGGSDPGLINTAALPGPVGGTGPAGAVGANGARGAPGNPGAANQPEIFSGGGSITQQTLTLVVTTPPPGSIAPGVPFGMTVTVEKSQAGVDTSYNGPVSLQLTANPDGATLGGTLTVNATNGVATFSNLTLNSAGVGYAITASSGGVNSAPAILSVVISGSPQPSPNPPLPPVKTPNPTTPTITSANRLDVTVLKGHGKHVKKTIRFAGFVLKLNESVNAATAQDRANYRVLQAVKKGRKTIEQPVGFQVSYDPSTTSVDITLSGKPAFAAGGEIVVTAAGITDLSGNSLAGSTTFAILPKAKGIQVV